MASKNFKPEKSAKVIGGPANTFSQAVNEIMSKGTVSDSAKADAWGIHVNQIDWEVPASATPGTPHD